MVTIEQVLSKVRKNIQQLKPYSSARDEFKGTADVFLDANENPYGSPLKNGDYNRYPDPMQLSLKQKIAVLKRISTNSIFLGNGSDEPIDILFRIFCEPGKDEIIICPPTYGMYEVSANINDVNVKKVNLNQNFGLDTEGILNAVDSKTKMIFICSPNNPSGNSMKPEDVKKILRLFSGVVILDEAYIDFSEEKSFVNELGQFPNLVILQTFSKAYGMAGLRLGMAFAHEEIVSLMNKVKPPYNLNSYTIREGMEAIESSDKVKVWISELINEREKLRMELKKLQEVEIVFPSEANFLLVKFKNCREVYQRLADKGIVVRDRSSQVNCENCLRITVGTPEENEKIIMELKSVYA